MNTTEWKWKTADGLEMYSMAWVPDGNARAAVCLVHGLGEHINRYGIDGEALTAAGYVLAGFDQRGFGRSEGQRGHTPSLKAYYDDIGAFLDQVNSRFPGVPRFLLGFSMGGVLVIGYTQDRRPQVAGVMAFSPGLKSELEEQKFKIFLAKALGGLMPTLTFQTGLETWKASRNPSVAQELLDDPLVHFRVSAAWAKSMIQGLEMAWKDPESFPAPLLLMHGTADEIADPDGSRRFAELAPKDKVTLRMWEGFKHELHTDPENAEVFRAMIEWMDQRS